MVTPIFAKTCYYNYMYNLNDAKAGYLKDLKRVLNAPYLATVRHIMALPPAVDQVEFASALEWIQDNYGDKPAQTFEKYGRVWNLAWQWTRHSPD